MVLASNPLDPKKIHALSAGMIAAGEPVVSHDGSRVVFAAKAAQGADWQIYEVKLSGNAIKPLTAAPGGAMNPALLADGSLLYVSPVPKAGASNSFGRTPAIYVQPPGGEARSAHLFNCQHLRSYGPRGWKGSFRFRSTLRNQQRHFWPGAVYHEQRWHWSICLRRPARCPEANPPAQTTSERADHFYLL